MKLALMRLSKAIGCRKLVVGLLLLGLAGCAASDWHRRAEDDLGSAQQAQVARADAARQALFNRLLTRLQAVLPTEGPAAAIAVCRDEAPRLAREVSQETGVRIGRTSWGLRNPANAPPSWAEPLVRRRVARPTYLVHEDGRLAALLPIMTAQTCLTCHGDPATIAAPVRQALAQHYPQDAALGFGEGDLRGWFWVEVPPVPQAPPVVPMSPVSAALPAPAVP